MSLIEELQHSGERQVDLGELGLRDGWISPEDLLGVVMRERRAEQCAENKPVVALDSVLDSCLMFRHYAVFGSLILVMIDFFRHCSPARGRIPDFRVAV